MLGELHDIATRYSINITHNWTETALQLNAADVARKRYEEVTEVIALSTTRNIPNALRLQPTEIDVTFTRPELVGQYTSEIPKKIATDFLINTVSWLDAYLEDVYDLVLLNVGGETDENRRGNLVRSAWSNNNLRNLLLNNMGLQTPPYRRSTPSMTLNRYEEWREIRHAIMHNRGILGDKHLRKLEELKQRDSTVPAMIDSPLIDGRNINIDYSTALILRKFAHEFIGFMQLCFETTLRT